MASRLCRVNHRLNHRRDSLRFPRSLVLNSCNALPVRAFRFAGPKSSVDSDDHRRVGVADQCDFVRRRDEIRRLTGPMSGACQGDGQWSRRGRAVYRQPGPRPSALRGRVSVLTARRPVRQRPAPRPGPIVVVDEEGLQPAMSAERPHMRDRVARIEGVGQGSVTNRVGIGGPQSSVLADARELSRNRPRPELNEGPPLRTAGGCGPASLLGRSASQRASASRVGPGNSRRVDWCRPLPTTCTATGWPVGSRSRSASRRAASSPHRRAISYRRRVTTTRRAARQGVGCAPAAAS